MWPILSLYSSSHLYGSPKLDPGVYRKLEESKVLGLFGLLQRESAYSFVLQWDDCLETSFRELRFDNGGY